MTTDIINTARHKWPEILVQLLDNAAQTIARSGGITPEKSELMAMEVVGEQAKLFGGQQIYLPKGDELTRALRDREIYKQAGRVDVAILARRYNISMRQVWLIQQTQRELHIQHIQPVLF